MDKLLELAKKFVARVEASPSAWQVGYPELAQEFRAAIETAQQSVHTDPPSAIVGIERDGKIVEIFDDGSPHVSAGG